MPDVPGGGGGVVSSAAAVGTRTTPAMRHVRVRKRNLSMVGARLDAAVGRLAGRVARIPRSPSESSRSARLLTRVEQHALTAVVAVVVFMVAFDNGGYGLSPRSILGIAC